VAYFSATRPAAILGEKPNKPRIGPHFRPAIEVLEGRVVPAAYTWTGGVSTAWNDAGNWAGGATFPSGAGDSATITHVENPCVISGITASVGNLTVNGGSLEVSGGGTLGVTGRLFVSNGGFFDDDTTVTVSGQAQISGARTRAWVSGNLYAADIAVTFGAFVYAQGVFPQRPWASRSIQRFTCPWTPRYMGM
jgi:hypothetical protein